MGTVSKVDLAEQLKARTKKFAVQVIKFCEKLPKTDEARLVKQQLVKSSTSVAANYRAVCRARSNAEFYAKLCIVVEEADETALWLEILDEAELSRKEETNILLAEAKSILSIMAASRKTTKDRYVN